MYLHLLNVLPMLLLLLHSLIYSLNGSLLLLL